MVSVEVQSAYWIPLRANPLTNFFIDFLDEKHGLIPSMLNVSDNDSVACNLFIYVRDNNLKEATNLYDKLITRQVRPDSEWIHNDYLVFALICTVSKFQLDNQWVRDIILKRSINDMVQRQVNKSFDNLLAGNYNAKEDFHQIAIVFQLVIRREQFDLNCLHEMFAYLWRCPFPYFESEFLNIVSLRAIRAAFEAKGLLDPEEQFVRVEFIKRFVNKAILISKILTYTIFIISVLGLSVGAIFYAEYGVVKSLLGTLATLGIGASSLAEVRVWLAIRIERTIKKFWGYHPPAPPTK